MLLIMSYIGMGLQDEHEEHEEVFGGNTVQERIGLRVRQLWTLDLNYVLHLLKRVKLQKWKKKVMDLLSVIM